MLQPSISERSVTSQHGKTTVIEWFVGAVVRWRLRRLPPCANFRNHAESR
ncbi:hypothetical protein [Novipirellula galeiformis]|nr:hypothetical protein [Novipirellula galeiformis]